MEYQRSQNIKEYAREVVSNSAHIRMIAKNPQKPARDYITNLKLILLAMALVFIGLLILIFMSKDILCAQLSGMFLTMIILYVVKIVSCGSTINAIVNSTEKARVELTPEGVIRTGEYQVIKVYWSSIRCMRVYKYSILFLGKDLKSTPIMAPVENLENFKAFIEENNIEVQVIS